MLFSGLSAFPITPTDHNGRVDTSALSALVERIAAAPAASIGLLGSTGGYAYLTRAEKQRAMAATVECVAGRIPVLVGVGALRTDEAQALARDAAAAGADAVLLAPMSYTKLLDAEVEQHFLAVADSSDLPLCIYNNPGTTNFTFSDDLLVRLSAHERIKGVKMPLPADGDFAGELARLRARVRDGFAIGYSGDWGMADAMLAGSDGFYSVLGGILPEPALQLVRAAMAGDAIETARLNARLAPMFALFKELGSLRIMYVLADLLGLGQFQPPLPILPLPAAARERIAAALRD